MSLDGIFDPMVRAYFGGEADSGGGGLPVIEFTTDIKTGATLTEEESAALHSASESKSPVVMKAKTLVDGFYEYYDIVLNFCGDPPTNGIYSATVDGVDFVFQYTNNTKVWSITAEKSSSFPIVHDCPLNLSVGTHALDVANSKKILTAYYKGLPIVVKGEMNGINADFTPLNFNHAILFQVDFAEEKLYAQYGDKRIVISIVTTGVDNAFSYTVTTV